ncbi:Maf-like protein R00002 [Devosia pacifica]|uniref:Nucleoside triphosphate pyrophosphatase n=1 Tax=Devosia pacifica TaxID=1335967 RepID=A0A918S3Z0_9HYPH|nr:Maf family protein [Devosia pacifica]GHA23388.1 Maf-like protein R00002 [Devosia pacifica]
MLILASKSETRRHLLESAGLVFETHASSINERDLEAQVEQNGADARDVATLLAGAKARAVAAENPSAWVIGADQTLSLGPDRMNKPDSLDAARGQLDRLRGKTHRLHAAVVLARGDNIVWSSIETAELTMRKFSDSERDLVLELEGERVLGSVGSYRLEGPSIRLFERVSGDYFTILGLPLLALLEALREFAPEVLDLRHTS